MKRDNEFGEYLKFLRKLKGYSLSELARISGISQPYLSQLENQKRNPSVNVLSVLSDCLDTSFDVLAIKSGFLDKEQFESRIIKLDESKERINFLSNRIQDDSNELIQLLNFVSKFSSRGGD